MIFNKTKIDIKKRSDVLSGSLAEEFARSHAAIYNGDPDSIISNLYRGFVLLKSINGNEYYLAKLGTVKSLDGVETSVIVERIRPEGLILNIQDGEQPSSAVSGNSGFVDVNVISKTTKKTETIYFNGDMIPFKSNQHRSAFEKFAFDVYSHESTFESLAELSEYFADENFVIAARERIRSNIYDTEFQRGFFESTKLIKRANIALNMAVSQNKMGE